MTRGMPLVVDASVSCVGCGYNLRGLVSDGQCPECGLAIRQSLESVLIQPRLMCSLRLLNTGYLLLMFTACVPILIVPSVIVHALAVHHLRFRSRLHHHRRIARWVRLLWVFMLIRMPILAGIAAIILLGLPSRFGRIDALVMTAMALGFLALLAELCSITALSRQIALALHHQSLAREMRLHRNASVIMLAITTILAMLMMAAHRSLPASLIDRLSLLLQPSLVALLVTVLGLRDLARELDLERARHKAASPES